MANIEITKKIMKFCFLPLLFVRVGCNRILSRRVREAAAAAVQQRSLCVSDKSPKIGVSAAVTLVLRRSYHRFWLFVDLQRSPQR